MRSVRKARKVGKKTEKHAFTTRNIFSLRALQRNDWLDASGWLVVHARLSRGITPARASYSSPVAHTHTKHGENAGMMLRGNGKHHKKRVGEGKRLATAARRGAAGMKERLLGPEAGAPATL